MQQVKDRDVLLKQKHIPMGFFAAWLMVITTIGWQSMIHGVGLITSGCALIACAFWAVIRAKGYFRERLDS